MNQSYEFYLDKMLLPVTPSKVTTKILNQNKTINLINEGEVNLIKPAGLTEISFDALLPMNKYPFAKYVKLEKTFVNRINLLPTLSPTINYLKENPETVYFLYPNYYLEYLESLKTSLEPFSFKITRSTNGLIYFTDIYVTLEDYSIVEDAKDGNDVTVSIKLKQYVEYGTKSVALKDIAKGKTKTPKRKDTVDKSIPKYYIVKQGDTLWKIAKKLLGDGSKCWNLAKLNGIKNPNLIKVGQKLKIQDVKSGTAKEAGYSISNKPRRTVSTNNTSTNNAIPNNTNNSSSNKKNSIVTKAVIVDPLNYDTSKLNKHNNTIASGGASSAILGLTGIKGQRSAKEPTLHDLNTNIYNNSKKSTVIY